MGAFWSAVEWYWASSCCLLSTHFCFCHILVFCRLTCPHEHLGWQLQDFTDLLWLHSLFASSLGLLLWGNVLQFIPKFVFVSHRFYFSNCTLFTSETKTWKLSWSVNARAYPTSFHTKLILLLHSRDFTMCIRVPLLHPLLFCILNFTFMRLTLWYAPNLPLHFPAMAFPI